jgi:hypothetical protein
MIVEAVVAFGLGSLPKDFKREIRADAVLASLSRFEREAKYRREEERERVFRALIDEVQRDL